MDVGVYQPSRAATQIEFGQWLIDLGFQGRGGVVAAYLLSSRRELALIETGPSSTLPNLLAAVEQAGYDPRRITKALVTHIHLDHAGAAGPLARMLPDLEVYVHPVGAPHLADPSKLVASATRIYGDRMEPLWGEVAPIPERQIRVLADGERLTVAERELQVVFTPGHASHHVAFYDPESGSCYTGDVGGIRMPGTGYVCPPTPPPDLDPAAWRESLGKLRALGVRRWCLTHFGPYDDPDAHLDRLEADLEAFVALGLGAIARGDAPDDVTALLHAHMADHLGPVPEGTLTNLEWATPSYMATLGLQRLYKLQGASPKPQGDR